MTRSKISKKRKRSFKRKSFRKRNYSKKRRGGGNMFTRNMGTENRGNGNRGNGNGDDLRDIPLTFDMPIWNYEQIRALENTDTNIMLIKNACLPLYIEKDTEQRFDLLPDFDSLKILGLFPIDLPNRNVDPDPMRPKDGNFIPSWGTTFNNLSAAIEPYKKNQEDFGNIWKSIYLVLTNQVPTINSMET